MGREPDIVPSRCSIPCPDGYRLHYRTWKPGGVPRATIVLLNGVMSHSGWFQPLAAPLVRVGFAVIGADRRGTGLNLEARGDAPSAAVLLEDVKRIIDAERVGDAPLHLAGWCWGAVLAINVAAAHAGLFETLVLLAPGLYPTDVLGARMRDQEPRKRSSSPDDPCLQSPISEDMFTAGPYLESFIVKDEHRCRHFTPRFHDIMAKLSMGAAVRLGALRLPILVVLATADRATDNAQTVRGFERLAKTQVSIEHVQGAHGLQFDAPEELARILVPWLGSGTGATASSGRSDGHADR
jgi:alpha-beta hydrolase superfamily lysophospholipase